MGIKESNTFKEILISLSPLGCRIFRNNRGMFMTLDGQRKVKAGLDAPGSGDGIGFTVVEILPAMIGRKLAVFTSVEAKFGKNGLSDDQKAFIKAVETYGGFAISAHSAEEAVAKIKGCVARLAE